VFCITLFRGIERRKIFRNDKDREDFLDRLSTLLPKKNGVKSTVDPCSKLIRVKSRLDPSDLKSGMVLQKEEFNDIKINYIMLPFGNDVQPAYAFFNGF